MEELKNKIYGLPDEEADCKIKLYQKIESQYRRLRENIINSSEHCKDHMNANVALLQKNNVKGDADGNHEALKHLPFSLMERVFNGLNDHNEIRQRIDRQISEAKRKIHREKINALLRLQKQTDFNELCYNSTADLLENDFNSTIHNVKKFGDNIVQEIQSENFNQLKHGNVYLSELMALAHTCGEMICNFSEIFDYIEKIQPFLDARTKALDLVLSFEKKIKQYRDVYRALAYGSVEMLESCNEFGKNRDEFSLIFETAGVYDMKFMLRKSIDSNSLDDNESKSIKKLYDTKEELTNKIYDRQNGPAECKLKVLMGIENQYQRLHENIKHSSEHCRNYMNSNVALFREEIQEIKNIDKFVTVSLSDLFESFKKLTTLSVIYSELRETSNSCAMETNNINTEFQKISDEYSLLLDVCSPVTHEIKKNEALDNTHPEQQNIDNGIDSDSIRGSSEWNQLDY